MLVTLQLAPMLKVFVLELHHFVGAGRQSPVPFFLHYTAPGPPPGSETG